MSFLTDTDVNWKANNLFMALENVASTLSVQSNFTSAQMQFEAVYLAAIPTALPIGGTWNPAFTGTNVVFSSGNRVATFSGVGTCISNTMQNIIANARYFEIEILSETGAALKGSGHWPGNGFAPVLDVNAFIGGSDPNTDGSTVYENDGAILGLSSSTTGATYTAGDVIGVIINLATNVSYYKNGVLQNTALFGNVFARAMATLA